MRIRTIFLTLIVALLAFGCAEEEQQTVTAKEVYGTSDNSLIPIPAKKVAKTGESYVGEHIAIKGRVVSVCEKRGCWLALDTGSPVSIRIKVPRDDHGEYVYTVPTTINGETVVADGVLFSTLVDSEMSQHLAEDAGETVVDPGSKSELQMVASGIQVL